MGSADEALLKAGWTVAPCGCCWAPPGGLEDTDEALFALRGEWVA